MWYCRDAARCGRRIWAETNLLVGAVGLRFGRKPKLIRAGFGDLTDDSRLADSIMQGALLLVENGQEITQHPQHRAQYFREVPLGRCPITDLAAFRVGDPNLADHFPRRGAL